MNAAELLKKPEAARDRGLFALFGDDEYLRRRCLEAIVQAVFEGKDSGLGLSRFDGPKTELAEVLDELAMLPFLSPRRVVVVEEADAFVTAHRKELEHFAEQGASKGVLILLVKTWPSSTRLAKLFEKVGLSVDCKTPRESEMAGLAGQLAKAVGADLEHQAAQLLVELVGPEPGRLASEVEKLAVAVAPSTRIKREDVARYVDGGRIESLWKLLDDATTGQLATALSALERLLESGEPPIKIVAGASVSLLKTYHAGDLRRRGRPLRQAALDAGVPPFAVEKTGAQHGHLGPRRVDALPATLLALDLDLKGSSTLSPSALLERLIVRLARPRVD